LAMGATVIFALVTVALATVREVTWLYGILFVGGGAWIALMSSYNAAAQAAAPAWVRARALAVYLLVFQGGMAAGSALWGVVAARTGIPTALLVAGPDCSSDFWRRPAIGWPEEPRWISRRPYTGPNRPSPSSRPRSMARS
jgi:MFS family permease